MKANYAIVHRGAAHRDEFLALGLACHAGLIDTTTRVYRKDPEDHELADPRVLVLDVGRSHDPKLLNFDHHQFERGVKECAFSLLAQYLRHNGGTYHSLLSGAPWYQAVVILDSCGPFALAKELGLEKIPDGLISPIETGLVDSLSDMDSVPPMWLTAAKLVIDQKVATAMAFKEAFEWLTKNARFVEVEGFTALVAVTKKTLGLSEFRKKSDRDVAVSVTCDDRGPGWTIYRFDDDPRVDLSKLEGRADVVFAHKGGFIAKTGEMSESEVLGLVELARV